MNKEEINEMMRHRPDGSHNESLFEKILICVLYLGLIVLLIYLPNFTYWRF